MRSNLWSTDLRHNPGLPESGDEAAGDVPELDLRTIFASAADLPFL